jgi:hypothetical protein
MATTSSGSGRKAGPRPAGPSTAAGHPRSRLLQGLAGRAVGAGTPTGSSAIRTSPLQAAWGCWDGSDWAVTALGDLYQKLQLQLGLQVRSAARTCTAVYGC